jgi:hypothetical protein
MAMATSFVLMPGQDACRLKLDLSQAQKHSALEQSRRPAGFSNKTHERNGSTGHSCRVLSG